MALVLGLDDSPTAPAAIPPPNRGRPGGGQHENRKVLVVDDEPAIIVYLTTVLEDAGYETCSTSEPEETLHLIKEERPSLVCLDIMMPRKSGLSVYQDLKTCPETKGVPVIFVSAFSQLHDLRNSEYFRKLIPNKDVPRPEACIEKPIDVTEFLKAVASFIGTPEPKTDSNGAEMQ